MPNPFVFLSRLAVDETPRSTEKVKNKTELIFSLAFCAAAVTAPWILHHFNLAGPRYLPINFFVVLATLLFGWRSGLGVGIFSTLISFQLLKMPPIAILPRILLEILCLSLLLDLLKFRKRLKPLFAATLGVISAKTLIVVIALLAFNVTAFKQTISNLFVLAWPGILLQIFLIPVLLKSLKRFWSKNA